MRRSRETVCLGARGLLDAEYENVTLLAEIQKLSLDAIPITLAVIPEIDLAVASLRQGDIFRFLRKPWESDEFKREITDTLYLNHLITNKRPLRNELAKADKDSIPKSRKWVRPTNYLSIGSSQPGSALQRY